MDELPKLSFQIKFFAVISPDVSIVVLSIMAILHIDEREMPLTGLERLRAREAKVRERRLRLIREAIDHNRILKALKASAKKAGSKRKIEAILTHRQSSDSPRGFRRRAVLVDGLVEPVHYLRAERRLRGRGKASTATVLSRTELETSSWVIFFIDVPGHRRRVLRCKSKGLLRALFPWGSQRRSVYIPLDRRPANPRYDFLADEDNW